MGGYRRAKLGGRDVAGAMPLMQEGQPPAWSTYISVDDADAIARGDPGKRRHDGRRADGRGDLRAAGDLHRPRGRFLRDLGAGRLRRGRAGQRARRLLLERARDPRPRARRRSSMAASSAGSSVDEDAPGGMDYNVAHVGENRVAGMADISGRMPDEVPAHWMTYFVVESPEGAIEKTEAGGGAVQFGPIDIPVGRFAMLDRSRGRGLRRRQVRRRRSGALTPRPQNSFLRKGFCGLATAGRGGRPLRSGRRSRPRHSSIAVSVGAPELPVRATSIWAWAANWSGETPRVRNAWVMRSSPAPTSGEAVRRAADKAIPCTCPPCTTRLRCR